MLRRSRPILLGALVGLALPGLAPAHASARPAHGAASEHARAHGHGARDRERRRTARPKRRGRPAAPHVPRTFFGLTSEDALATGTATPDTFGLLAQLGAGIVREPFRWRRIETAPGVYDFSFYDAFVVDAARAGLRVLPLLFEPPDFRSSAPSAGAAARGTWPPASDADFARFAAVLVARYGPGGTLWAEHPEVAPLPVRSWQVWNEPNLRVNWPGGPDPAAYAAMLRAVGATIRAADPGAEIVTAGLPRSAGAVAPERFLARMYRAGARGTFDTLGVHPYARSVRGSLEVLAAMRRVMNRFGDRRARMWATEIGWATGGPAGRFTVGSAAQARLIRQGFAAFARKRGALRLRGVIYYSWKDAPRWGDARDGWDHHLGLIAADGQAKPGLAAFRSAVRTLTAPVSVAARQRRVHRP